MMSNDRQMKIWSDDFQRNGYIPRIDVLNREESAQLKENFNQLEKDTGKLNSQYSLHNVHMKLPWVMKLATHSNVLRSVRAILGNNIILLDSRFICKYPEQENGPRMNGVKQYVAWHQDVRYWGVDGEVVTVWLAVDKADLQNGCMLVIPGSHRKGILKHKTAEQAGNLLTSNQEIPTSLFDLSKAVACSLEPGQMSLHHGLTVHGSEPNLSNRRRCGYVIRYVGTNSRPNENDPDRPRTFPATVLVSGEDDYHHFHDHAPKWFSRNI